MPETLLQTVILILPIYVLLTLLIIKNQPRRDGGIALPHRWGKPHPKNKPKRRKQHIRREENGEFKIEEEEKRPRGKPRGAKGGARHIPKKVDRTREAHPDRCPWCGAKIPKKQKPRKTQTRIVVDLEKRERGLIKTRTLWRVHWIRCPNCGKLASGGNKVNAEKGCTYGYGVRAHVLYMYQEQRLTITDIVKTLKPILGEDTPTTQTVRDWVNKTAQKNKPLLPKLLKLAKKEKYLEVDETGIPMEGEKKKNWLWIIETRKATIYLARRTRGHKAVEELLRDYVGIIIADFWKAYDKFPHRKQRSLAHLYRKIADPLWELVENIEKTSKKLMESENQHPQEGEKPPEEGDAPERLKR